MRKLTTLTTLLSALGIIIGGLISQVSIESWHNVSGEVITDRTEWVVASDSYESVLTVSFFAAKEIPHLRKYTLPDFSSILSRTESLITLLYQDHSTAFQPNPIFLANIPQLLARNTLDSLHS